MEKKNQRKKLTLSLSGSLKKPQEKIEKAKTVSKNSIIVEKKNLRFSKQRSGLNQFKNEKTSNLNPQKPIQTKDNITNKDNEKRKLAEQRATKRLKGESVNEKDARRNLSGKKREYKLTLSRALNEEDSLFKSRSLASIKRAKQKENRLLDDTEGVENLKPIVRDVNISETITIRELANRMAEQSNNIIKHLFGMGVVATINHSIDADTAEYLVKEFGHNPVREEKIDFKISRVSAKESTKKKKDLQ